MYLKVVTRVTAITTCAGRGRDIESAWIATTFQSFDAHLEVRDSNLYLDIICSKYALSS